MRNSAKNHLAGSLSPYLLMHEDNPVDWYPWGQEALELARSQDRPIFLSIGYSTCYWCHVMERESFSDAGIARFMNEHFVNIKVDREERPDLDEVYMTATQILSGQGGWPMSVFMTPDLKPFFTGTYFPPQESYGHPAFRSVLESMAQAWQERRADVEAQAESVFEALQHYLGERESGSRELPGPELAEIVLRNLEQRFDPEWGGFGQAPKFPMPANLFLLLDLASDHPRAGEMLSTTLDHMARGGLMDQVGGGFHRYSTDREWLVPHFEKMLYDNALLLEVYARQASQSGDPQAIRVAHATGNFLCHEMSAPEGGFWSAIDAESDGREGAFYSWSREELAAALGEEGYGFLAPIFGFAGPPFFEDDRYVLHLPRALEDQAARRRLSVVDLNEQIEPLRERLDTIRRRRNSPRTDDKVLCDWTGMAIAGLACAGALLGESAWVERAERAASFVLENLHLSDGSLCHVWRAGKGAVGAFLSDYAFLIRGLVALHEAAPNPRWLEAAVRLAEEQERRLGDPRGGYFSSERARDLLVQSKPLLDGALPSANGVAALNLSDLARLSERDFAARAERSLRVFSPEMNASPEATPTLVLVLRRWRELSSGREP